MDITRIKQLVRTIDLAEAELAELVGATPKTKRGRALKETQNGEQPAESNVG